VKRSLTTSFCFAGRKAVSPRTSGSFTARALAKVAVIQVEMVRQRFLTRTSPRYRRRAPERGTDLVVVGVMVCVQL